MLELVKTKVEVSFEGQVYSLRVPTYTEGMKYEQSLKDAATDAAMLADALFSYLAELGLPREVTKNFELGHMMQVIEFISTGKKK